MKKLMFATALVASAAAFADPTAINDDNAIGFNGYGLGSTFGPGATYANGAAELDENGNSKAAANGYFYFDGDSNSSVVTNESPSTTKHTAFFASAEDAKYLALDTEGGTLWRSINTLSKPTEDTYDLGTAKTVAATGTYLDTLVQFTVTEDEEPEVTSGDKLAIWLQAGEGTTNLMVKAKGWALDGSTPTGVATNFTVSNVAVEPGAWYRLTVKAVQTIIDPATGMIIPAFQIFIDGTEVAATTPQIATEIQEAFTGNNVWIEGMAALASANKLFPTLAEDPNALTDVTLQGVGFKGTGAVDEIVWTEENPLGASGVDFTLTWDANVTAVSYTIDGTTTTIADLSTYTNVVSVAPNTVVTVAATPAAWFEISSGTGAVTVASAMTQDITTALAATPADAGATGLPASVTTAQAKTWADAKNLTPAQIAASTFAEKAYLLNTDLTTEPTFAISAIEEVEGGWQITVEAKSGSTEIDLENINGTLKVKTAATLAALGSATSDDIPAANLSFDSEGKAVIKITGTGKNFIKATVE